MIKKMNNVKLSLIYWLNAIFTCALYSFITDKIYGGPKAGLWELGFIFLFFALCVPFAIFGIILNVSKTKWHKIGIVYFVPLMMIICLQIVLILLYKK